MIRRFVSHNINIRKNHNIRNFAWKFCDHEKDEIFFHLQRFCKMTDFDDCIDFLKSKLDKNTQISEYDNIYNSFIKTNNYDENTIIPGLEYKMRLLVFCKFYDCFMFPMSIQPVKIHKKHFAISLLLRSFSCSSFIETYLELSSEQDFIPISFSNERLYFPYVLISSDDIDDISKENTIRLLFENSIYSKIPLRFSMITSQSNDQDVICYYNFTLSSSNYNIVNNFIPNTVKRRIIEVYLYSYTYLTIDDNPFDNFEQKFLDVQSDFTIFLMLSIDLKNIENNQN